MITNKTIKSKYQPKQTNVTWVDLNGKTPVEKHFINGKWVKIGGDGGSNSGYNLTKQTVTLFNDTIETHQTEEDLYNGVVMNVDFDLVVGETYTVVFDGTSYDVKATSLPFQEGSVILGEINNGEDPSFETYPFAIMYEEQEGIKGMALFTTTEGSHTVVIKHEEETVTTTPEFKSAVDSVTGYSIDKENETFSTKTTPEFESMIQGIAGGSESGCQIIYPDSISWVDTLYSQYNKEPEAGKIYFIPFGDTGSSYGQYLYPVHIDELTNDDNKFSGRATIIGNPIIIDNGTLTAQPFNHTINPGDDTTKGLCIKYDGDNNNYRLFYGFGGSK